MLHHFKVPSAFAQQVIQARRTLRRVRACVCVDTCAGCTGPGPVLLTRVPPWLAGPPGPPPSVLGADLAVQMGCRFSLQNYRMEVLAPLKKQIT